MPRRFSFHPVDRTPGGPVYAVYWHYAGDASTMTVGYTARHRDGGWRVMRLRVMGVFEAEPHRTRGAAADALVDEGVLVMADALGLPVRGVPDAG